MGKKLEKGIKEKNQSAASQETPDDNPNKTPEPYACTGNFQNDFTELCRRTSLQIIPPVLVRPKLPISVTSHTPSEGKGEKGKKGQQQQPEPEPEIELTENGEPVEPPPKTYTTQPSFEYFKPSVQVEMENPEKGETVTEVHVRGWKVDIIMMGTFQQCWPMMEKLHTINLWNAGLTGDTISMLSTFLPHCANVKTLILDGNNVKEQNYHQLINNESLLQNLSLRFCGINDIGMERLGKALGTAQKYNLKLLSLNLSGNNITDVGAVHLATGLRMNRALLSLSLANNQIGDVGATKIAEVLSRFALTHEETVERRKIKSDSGSPERLKSPTSSRRGDSRDRPGSVRSTSHMDKSRRDKSSKKKPDGKPTKDVKEETKGGKKAEKDDKAGTKKGGRAHISIYTASIVAEAGKTMSKTKDAKKKKDKGGTPQDIEAPETPDHVQALNDPVDYIDGSLWISGNRVLINLNLSRNKIGEAGMSAILKAVQYQTTLTQLESRSSGTGLMRISLLKNEVPSHYEVMKKIVEMMAPKDPYYKAPAKSPDEELVPKPE